MEEQTIYILSKDSVRTQKYLHRNKETWRFFKKRELKVGERVLSPFDDEDNKLIESFKNKQMIKQAKVTQVVSVKPWQGNHGTIQYCQVVLDNGDKIEIGKKQPVQVGWDLTYEIVGDDQQEYRKAKSAKLEQFNGGGNRQAPQQSNDRLKGIEVGHAINNAVNLVCANGTDGKELRQAIKDNAVMIYQISQELNNEL